MEKLENVKVYRENGCPRKQRKDVLGRDGHGQRQNRFVQVANLYWVSFAEDPDLSKAPIFKPSVDQNIVLHALPAARILPI